MLHFTPSFGRERRLLGEIIDKPRGGMDGGNTERMEPTEAEKELVYEKYKAEFLLHVRRPCFTSPELKEGEINTLRYKYFDIDAFTQEGGIAMNYDRVQESWVREYFKELKPSSYFDGEEGKAQMIAWKILVARLLAIEGCVRDCVKEDRVKNTLTNIWTHRKHLEKIPFLTENVVCISGSRTVDKVPEWENLSKDKQQDVLRDYGPYELTSTAVVKMFQDQMGKTIAAFRHERLQKLKSKAESVRQKEDFLLMISKEQSGTTFIFNGHGIRNMFLFHQQESDRTKIPPEEGISVDELVKVFVQRAQRVQKEGKTYHLPIGLMNGEYGQRSIKTFSDFPFFRDILQVDRGGAKIGQLIGADEERKGLNNFVLYVPGMNSMTKNMNTINYNTVDRIVFMQCDCMNFATRFYQELQRRLGGKQYYLPITRREDKRRAGEVQDETGVV